jgi:uncharacterized membrane protein
MTRAEFMARLRRGLVGLPSATVTEAAADYEAHFDEALAAGRSEQEAAAALGDPTRLARELRAELGLKRWEEQKSPSSAMGAILALLGLGALDLIILLPLLMSVVSAMLSMFVAVVVMIFAGGAVIVAGPFLHDHLSPWLPVVTGVGIVGAATSAGAILALVSIGLVNALVWYGRLHFKLLKPAIEPQA